MAKYRKKPVVIEAFRYWIDSRPDWFCDRVSENGIITYDTHCEIKTLEGVMRGEVGDYIIQGVNGEIYPCKPDIFEKTNEPVDGVGELGRWQQYAGYCRSCALSGEHDPDSFKDFVERMKSGEVAVAQSQA